MVNKKELKKEYEKIRGKQIHNGDEPEDMYPIMSDVLFAGLRYIPNKVLKQIIEKYK